MRAFKRFVTAVAVAALTAGGLVSATSVAQAYGGDGSMDVYQIGLSFNCDNKSVCGADNLGGFWGWAELDHNPATNKNTGDAQFTGCSHETFNGMDTGLNLVTGHQSGTDIFGIKPPPGVSMQIQISFKPAH
ncbi:hypothetical protein ACQHIV_38060 [Kribbella sp. GL6]|uniref:hypothetical protein n=1 Tax=Kribbella sp. GL6 TaxID=3419765 RepID=UPI003CFF6438